MSLQIDTRPIRLILAIKSLRPVFFLLLAVVFLYLVLMPVPQGLTVEGQRAIAVFLL